MDHISRHLNNQGRSTTTTQAGSTTQSCKSTSAETGMMIDKIFKELQAIYPAWKQAYSSTEALGETKKQWIKGLMDSGISDYSLIDAGIGLCRTSGKPFIPTVGEFIDYCHKAVRERIGALETMDAYHHLMAHYTKPVELREPCDMDPLVYHTISQAGFDVYRFKRMQTQDSVKYFSEQYRGTLRHASIGGTLKAPIKKEHRIENPTGVVHGNSEEIARKTLDELKDMLKG